MRKIAMVALLLCVACSGPAVRPASVQPPAPAGEAGAATITPTDIYARIAFLASDALRGRDTPSQGLETAAAYIASEYTRLGLQPRGDNGSYLQRYPYAIRTLLADSVRLAVSVRGQTSALAYGREMFASAGMPERARGPLVFAGTKFSTDGADFQGALPVVFIPGSIDRTWRTALNTARNGARRLGANGLIVVLDPSITAERMQQASALFSTGRGTAATSAVGFVRYDKARELMRAAGADLDALVASARSDAFKPVPLKTMSAELVAPVSEVVHHPPNVVAVLEGSDPELKNTYVVLSAHMDHVGVQAPDARGDSIYNGADDDASGTSAVVEAAEAFAALSQRPLRSIVFLNVSGEEKGLLGSQYFSEHPAVPLSSIVADINIDMIGRNAPDSVVAIGQDYSSLGSLTQEVVRNHPELHLTAARDLWPQERFFFRSDHFNFAKKDIPAIFFFTGTHEDYHRPSDEVQKINTDKAARVARLAYYLALEIASRREPHRWTEQGLKEVRAL
ncbi:MAG TPA: M20/M25/M40 family metallo-hydrolase, partial [Longimicrobiales bacterium]